MQTWLREQREARIVRYRVPDLMVTGCGQVLDLLPADVGARSNADVGMARDAARARMGDVNAGRLQRLPLGGGDSLQRDDRGGDDGPAQFGDRPRVAAAVVEENGEPARGQLASRTRWAVLSEMPCRLTPFST